MTADHILLVYPNEFCDQTTKNFQILILILNKYSVSMKMFMMIKLTWELRGKVWSGKSRNLPGRSYLYSKQNKKKNIIITQGYLTYPATNKDGQN